MYIDNMVLLTLDCNNLCSQSLFNISYLCFEGNLSSQEVNMTEPSSETTITDLTSVWVPNNWII